VREREREREREIERERERGGREIAPTLLGHQAYNSRPDTIQYDFILNLLHFQSVYFQFTVT
jgi:hypothetical protein